MYKLGCAKYALLAPHFIFIWQYNVPESLGDTSSMDITTIVSWGSQTPTANKRK